MAHPSLIWTIYFKTKLPPSSHPYVVVKCKGLPRKMAETFRIRIYMKLPILIAGLISHKANGLWFIKGSLDEKLPSYELLKMLKETDQ